MIATAIAIALLTLSVAIYLAAPLFASRDNDQQSAATSELMELATRQAAVYATLKELDFDLTTGKISELDHAELKQRYTAEAVEILRKMDSLAKETGQRQRSR